MQDFAFGRRMKQFESADFQAVQRGDRASSSGSHLGCAPIIWNLPPFLKTEPQPTLPIIRHIGNWL
jgi:hypothetical protein